MPWIGVHMEAIVVLARLPKLQHHHLNLFRQPPHHEKSWQILQPLERRKRQACLERRWHQHPFHWQAARRHLVVCNGEQDVLLLTKKMRKKMMGDKRLNYGRVRSLSIRCVIYFFRPFGGRLLNYYRRTGQTNCYAERMEKFTGLTGHRIDTFVTIIQLLLSYNKVVIKVGNQGVQLIAFFFCISAL